MWKGRLALRLCIVTPTMDAYVLSQQPAQLHANNSHDDNVQKEDQLAAGEMMQMRFMMTMMTQVMPTMQQGQED